MRYSILHPREIILGILCLAITLMILMAGLWPFNFWPENKVNWLKDGNGVHFSGRGIILSEPVANTSQSSFLKTGPMTLEIWLQPDTESQRNVPRILSLYAGRESEEFFIGQWKSALILRTKFLSPEKVWTYQWVGVANVLLKGQRRFIAITSSEKGTYIYIDGRLEKTSPDFAFIPKDGTALNQMILGNSPEGKAYWRGSISGLAIYNRSLGAVQVKHHCRGWTSGKVSSLS